MSRERHCRCLVMGSVHDVQPAARRGPGTLVGAPTEALPAEAAVRLRRPGAPAEVRPTPAAARASSSTPVDGCGYSPVRAPARRPRWSRRWRSGSRERGVAPEQILVLTFSRRAAAELTSRITERLGVTTREPIVRTLHGYAFAVLRRQAGRSGESVPRLLAAGESDHVVRELLAGHLETVPAAVARDAAAGPRLAHLRGRAAGPVAADRRAWHHPGAAGRAGPASAPARMAGRRPVRPRVPGRRRSAAGHGRPGSGPGPGGADQGGVWPCSPTTGCWPTSSGGCVGCSSTSTRTSTRPRPG